MLMPGTHPNARIDADEQPDLRARTSFIGRAAIVALYEELVLHPKPGLVSLVDSGSHDDMHAGTFYRSLFALRRYFPNAAALGAGAARFEQLEALGVQAEARMSNATGGINTHRGAVFTLGLLCAGAGALHAEHRACTPSDLRTALCTRWGDALRSRRSVGHAARRRGLRGANEEAALGFPVLFDHALPALMRARRQGLADDRAKLQALFAAMAELDDTNLAHRGGLEGLRFGRAAARSFLAAGGAARPDAIEHARALHREFVARRLSPGGAADLLAAACWVERVCMSR